MSSLVQPAAVVALANARVRDAREALERKLDASTVNAPSGGLGRSSFGNTERRVLGLLRAASDILGGRDPIPLPVDHPLAPGPSRYAVLGSVGFELPTYVDLFSTGGAWRSEVLRRGTRDPDRSRVAVPTTAFANAFGASVRARPDADERARGEAITLGLFGAIAHGVVVGPVARGAQSRVSNREWNRGLPGAFLSAVDERILSRLLGPVDPQAVWVGAWVTAGEAAPYWPLYVDALEATYGMRSLGPERMGFSLFEHGFDAPPELVAERVAAGYERLRSELTPWGVGPWFGVLTPLLLAPSLATLLTRLLPHAQRFNTTDALTERSFSELLTISNGLGAVSPFIYSMIMWSNVPDHSEAFWNALVLFLARVGLVAGWIPTIGGVDDDPSPAARWAIAGSLLGADVYAMIRAIVASGGRQPGSTAVFAMQTIPAMTSIAALTQAAIIKGIVSAAGDDGDDVASWVTWIVTTLGLWLGAGLPMAFSLSGTSWLSWFRTGARDTLAGSPPPAPPVESGTLVSAPGPGRGEPTAPVHLFDDSTLWFDPSVATPTLDDLHYPSGMRPLVRLWWTGASPLEIAHDGNLIRLRTGGTTTDVPVGPGVRTTASIVAALLVALPSDLHAEIADASETSDPDPDYDLPWPSTLADPGDDRATLAEHETARDTFVTVGDSREKAYLLRHAPRATLASTFGVSGPTASPLRGMRVVPQAGLGDVDDTALGTAADLAVVLSLGASSRLRDVTPAQPNPIAPVGHGAPARPAALADLRPVDQVFRQWNLDERRVNEWREIVAGGASPDGPPPPAPPPPPPPPPAPPPAGTREGRTIALAMGWVPLWRAWLRMATDTLSDADSGVAMAYAPTVTAHDGETFRPTNAELTAGVRHLFDLDP